MIETYCYDLYISVGDACRPAHYLLVNDLRAGAYDVNVIEKYDKNAMIVISLANRVEAEKIKNTLISKGYHNICFFNENWVIEKAV